MKSKILWPALFLLLALSPRLLANSQDYAYETIAENLDHPWGIAVLNNDDILVTELPGKLRLVKNATLVAMPLEGVPDVLFAGQGGLSGIALDPRFSENKKIYLAFSSPDSNEKTNTLEVVSAIYNETAITNVTTIFRSSPSRKTAAHYGARMVFSKMEPCL